MRFQTIINCKSKLDDDYLEFVPRNVGTEEIII